MTDTTQLFPAALIWCNCLGVGGLAQPKDLRCLGLACRPASCVGAGLAWSAFYDRDGR